MHGRIPVFSRKNKGFSRARHAAAAGFSLLELCVVIMISGILYAAVYQALSNNHEVKAFQTRQTMQKLQWGLAEYFRIFGYYPCPANPALATGNANFGLEDRNPATGACNMAGTANISIGMVPVRALNMVVGCDMVDADGTMMAAAPMAMPDNLRDVVQTALNSARQVIMMGGSEAAGMDVSSQKTRCIDPSFASDVYDSRIIYAVTRNSTKLNTINMAAGAVQIVDANGNDATAARQHFVLVSTGVDRAGSFTKNGTAGPGCAVPPPPPAPPMVPPRDEENCDGDDIFRAMPMAKIGLPGDAQHFDDTVVFSVYGFRQESTDWRWNALAATETAASQRDISMMNPGAALKIGRLRAPPAASSKVMVGSGNVEVEGTVQAETADIRAERDVTSTANITANQYFYAPKYCYKPAIDPTVCGP